jgi:hypothetical protein
MHADQPFHTLNFNHHFAINHQVWPVLAYELPLVEDRNAYLVTEGDAGSRQLDA